MEEWSLLEKEKTKFLAQLADFPHTFQPYCMEQLTVSDLNKLKSGLESALSVGYKTEIETARARNMLAYSLYRLKQPKEALQQLELVLDMESQNKNLVTLANKATILWNEQYLSEADDLVQALTEMKTEVEGFQYLVVLAEAELAFTYTRLRPSFFTYAIAKFEEVLPKAREPEKWLWQFGLALTKRRALRAKPQHISASPSPESTHERKSLLCFLMDIAENCDSRNLKAKAYAEIAILLFMVPKTPLNQEFYTCAGMTPEQACEKALALDPDDNSVLCKCGRMFRYCKQTERSRELLEKALSIRPSSTAYHHLGITYIILANCEKRKDMVKVSGYDHQLERQDEGHREAQNQNSAGQFFKQLSDRRPEYDGSASAGYHNAVDSDVAGKSTNNSPTDSLNTGVRAMQKMIKSPASGVTRFSRDDKFIEEALYNFKKAVDFSHGQNTRAIYDLALLQKSLGELDNAKKNLQEMLKKPYYIFTMDQINVYEQMGQIMQEQAESEEDEARKKHMLQNSTSMFQMALKSASEVYSRCPGVKEHLGELFSSFSVLLQEVEKSDHNSHWKLQEKARLFQLIKDHKHSLELLREIEQMDPEKSKDPEYLKLCIEEYVAVGQFEDALTFVEFLTCTSQSTTTMQLFEDKHFVLKIYIQAARQVLLHNEPSFAKLHFRPAFLEAATAYQNEMSSSECEDTDSSEDSRSDAKVWDIAILNEETKEAQTIANELTELLENVFGLKVALMHRDVPPTALDYEGDMQVMKRSTMVIVMAGGKLSQRIRYFIRNLAKQKSTVTLLVDGEHVPQLLKANRSLVCSPELLQSCKSIAHGQKTETEVDAVCNIFSFLVNVDMNMSED